MNVFDLASTRAVYERKLRKLLQADGCDEQANGEEENAVLYSDSEDEKDGENKFCYFFFAQLLIQQCGLLFCDLCRVWGR